MIYFFKIAILAEV